MKTSQSEMSVEGVGQQAPPIRLRGHHFLCLLTFKGMGYTPAFVENMTAVASAINAGERVVLADGPDDICNALSAEDRRTCDHDCGKPSTMEIDRLAIETVAPLIGADMRGPFLLTADTVATLRAAFAAGTIRAACGACRWREACDGISAGGYGNVKLFPDAVQPG